MKLSPLFIFISILTIFAPALHAQNDDVRATTAATAALATVASENKATEKTPKYEVQVQLSVESLSRGFGTWKSAAIYGERRFTNRRIVSAMYRVSERRGERDQEFITGVYQPFRGKWAVTAEAMFSPTRRFVGRYSAMVEVEKTLRKGFVVHGGTRFTDYVDVNAATGYGMLEKYFGTNRVAYTLYLTRLSNAGTAPSHRLQLNRYYGERNNTLGIAFTYGKEHENLGPRRGILRSQTWSTSISARHWINDKFGFSVDGTFHRQGDIYSRRGLTIGLRYRF